MTNGPESLAVQLTAQSVDESVRLPHSDRIVRKYVDDRKFHHGTKSDRRFCVVALKIRADERSHL